MSRSTVPSAISRALATEGFERAVLRRTEGGYRIYSPGFTCTEAGQGTTVTSRNGTVTYAEAPAADVVARRASLAMEAHLRSLGYITHRPVTHGEYHFHVVGATQ